MPGTEINFTLEDLQDPESFSRAVTSRSLVESSAIKTSRSITGTARQTVTSYTMSDILQGVYSVRDPGDIQLIINKALTGALEDIEEAGVNGGSRFSSADYDLNPLSGLVPGDYSGGQPGGGPSPWTGEGAEVSESWVRALPKEHESGAIIWKAEGKTSEEMHLPVSGDIEEDIERHLQLDDLPANRRHPYNMDRVQPAHGSNPWSNASRIDSAGYTINWAGGKDIIGSSGKTIGNEDPNLPGSPGAYASYYRENGGYLTPEAEQWYVSSSWAFKGRAQEFTTKVGNPELTLKASRIEHSAYARRRVLVYSVETSRAVVCTPGDWGPNISLSHIAGCSPDVMHYLGISHGADIIMGFMPDDTPLGPYAPPSSSTGPSPSFGSHPVASGLVLPLTGDGISVHDFVEMALTQEGKLYSAEYQKKASITDPNPRYFDCSGLIYWAAKRAGYQRPVELSHLPGRWDYSQTQYLMMKDGNTLFPSVEHGIATYGAILVRRPSFFGGPERSGHVAISLGDGRCMEAAGANARPQVGIRDAGGSGRQWEFAGYLPGMVFTHLKSSRPGQPPTSSPGSSTGPGNEFVFAV